MKLQPNEQDPSNDGIKGKLSFSLPDKDVVYFQGKLGVRLVRKICYSLGYREGTLINSPSSEVTNSLAFTLNPNNATENFCLRIFSEMIEGKEFSQEVIEELDNQCISQIDKKTVQLECNKEITISASIAAQNSWGDCESCPINSGVITRVCRAMYKRKNLRMPALIGIAFSVHLVCTQGEPRWGYPAQL